MSGHALNLVVAVFIARAPERFTPALRTLRQSGAPLVVGGPETLSSQVDVIAPTAAAFVADLWQRERTSILAIGDAVVPPHDLAERAMAMLEQDERFGTVSFLSNAAGPLSFPTPGRPLGRPPEGHDEQSVTRRLRDRPPAAEPTLAPHAAGAAVAISANALSAVGPPVDPPGGGLAASLTDFSLRARARGFLDVVDVSTYVGRPSDIATSDDEGDSAWLRERHPSLDALLEEAARRDSPLGLAYAVARSKVLGLTVLVDGGCLGPQAMGTQVTTLALINALAANDDVREVRVTLAGPVPPYAGAVLARPEVVSATVSPAEAVSVFGRSDVAHRPFQPNLDFEPDEWRSAADRVVVSVLDLIAYEIGDYHETPAHWLSYRRRLRDVVARVDGVAVISADVGRMATLAALPIEPTRLFVTTYGTDHLTGQEEVRLPAELFARGFAAEEFVLTLGANYSHKNRDLAVGTIEELRRRGWPMTLVLAGAAVPHGSSRVLEAAAGPGTDVHSLPDLPDAERHWLLRHAVVVLYPTSAEGFGLVPYEAARFGSPTVSVNFGSLREVGGSPPVRARDWSVEAFADAVEELLRDPAARERQVASTLAAGEKHTWSRTADDLVGVYRALLGRSEVAASRGRAS